MRKIALIVLLALLCTSAYAHGGKTDSNGGHMNHATGEYHYHHGYSAHQHEDGVCPYDFDDKTNKSSDSNWNNDNGVASVPTPMPAVKKEVFPMTIKNIITIFFIGFGLGLVLLFIYHYKVNLKINKMEQDAANRELATKRDADIKINRIQQDAANRELAAKRDADAREKNAINQGKRLAEAALAEREVVLQNREARLNQQINQMKVEADKFIAEACHIKSSLPPKEEIIKVLISETPRVRYLYHRINSDCIKTGHKVYLQTAIELGLQPCKKCRPDQLDILEIPVFPIEE